ncbi:hypothetical protein J3E68DRAFT_399858 [Trichoderma sp. SZMC 28012]
MPIDSCPQLQVTSLTSGSFIRPASSVREFAVREAFLLFFFLAASCASSSSLSPEHGRESTCEIHQLRTFIRSLLYRITSRLISIH